MSYLLNIEGAQANSVEYQIRFFDGQQNENWPAVVHSVTPLDGPMEAADMLEDLNVGVQLYADALAARLGPEVTATVRRRFLVDSQTSFFELIDTEE